MTDVDAVATADEAATVEAFHRLFYDSHDTSWKQTLWLGRTVRKCAFDLWAYQEILVETRPDLIVESGTCHGGSALFLASICELIGRGEVITVDIDSARRPAAPSANRLSHGLLGRRGRHRLGADGRDGAERVMVILDSDHSRSCSRELQLYRIPRDPRLLSRRRRHRRQRPPGTS